MSDFLPEEFKNRMKSLLGEEYDLFIQSFEEGNRYRGLRLNPLKLDGEGKSISIDKLNLSSGYEKIEWEPQGYYYFDEDQPGKSPLHEAGLYYIQEPSAMAPVPMLEIKEGENILDLCAAPGGKSTQIAARMGRKGLLVANEINPQRARILSENIERMGVNNAVVTNESPENLAKRFAGFFDKILVDAPCSGEGMFRKNDEAVSNWSVANVMNCALRQASILDDARTMLKKGGKIVYSTCTFAPEEDEESVNNFVSRHPDFKIEKMHRLWPHKIKGEGHFACLLSSNDDADLENDLTGSANSENSNSGKSNKEKFSQGLSKKDKKLLVDFLGDIVNESCFEPGGILSSGRIENFGDSYYLVPEDMISLSGMKIMRPGLCIGTMKKNRFEPAHSLALALDIADVKRSVNLGLSDAADYIKGLTKNVDGEKGWSLVCVEGYSLGWGKNAGGILKNHYPKGLRKG